MHALSVPKKTTQKFVRHAICNSLNAIYSRQHLADKPLYLLTELSSSLPVSSYEPPPLSRDLPAHSAKHCYHLATSQPINICTGCSKKTDTQFYFWDNFGNSNFIW